MDNALKQYRELRERVDRMAGELEATHKNQMVCAPGCCDCCTNLTVFSVEFEAIRQDLQQAGVTELPFDADASCGFLRDGLCSIYAFRPIICRTHGLPLVFLNEDLGEPEYNVTFCPKNFSDADAVEFGPDNTLDLDALNAELAEIQGAYAAEKRVALRCLCDM